jgi:membrane protein YdbS with pleckstrin-like domain
MTQPMPDVPLTPDTDRPHKPADDTEEVYYQGSPLLRAELGKLLLFWIIGLLLIAAPFIAYAVHGTWLPWFVTLGLIVIGLILLVIPSLLVRMTRYRISNYRIDFERGLLSRSIDTLELWHVEDISFHQSLLDRVLNVGDITVLSHDDTTPKLVLQGLPSPRSLFDSLKQRIIAVKRQRGVIKMDTGGPDLSDLQGHHG